MLTDPSYEKNHFITKVGCEQRASLVSDVNYDVSLALPKGEHYFGRTIATFNLNTEALEACSMSHPVKIDFRGLKVTNVTINGAATDGLIFDKHALELPKSALKGGENVVTILIYNKYRRDGVGLHSFTDPVDGLQYLFTDLECDFCHYVFPCMDQPDLKATWSLELAVADDWTALSNEAAVANELPGTGRNAESLMTTLKDIAASFEATNLLEGLKNTFFFQKSARISTYLYAIVAGPYDYRGKNVEGCPPMRIYARKTLINDVNFDEMFKVTEAGFLYYKELFGIAYPFNKYDQVFVPEFNYGAMENVGCVTYNERYLYRG
jgi:aminopeptidase N